MPIATLLTLLVRRRRVFIPGFLACCVALFALGPWLGQDFFPNTDSGQFILHMRAKTGTRIEETARLADLVEAAMRRVIPARELDTIVDNIGLPYSSINLTHTATGRDRRGGRGHHGLAQARPPPDRQLPRGDPPRCCAQEFPGVTFYSLPADMITQILNFGMPSPIDIQIDGANVRDNRVVADQILDQVRQVPGMVDARIQQHFDYPDFDIDVDRTKAQQNGMTERDVAGSLLETLSGSFQTAPMFFLNWKNGVNYQVAAQTPQYDIQSLHDIQNIPVTRHRRQRAGDPRRCRHDLPLAGDGGGGSLQHPTRGRCLRQRARARPWRGGAGHPAHRCANSGHLPRGSFVTIRGQLETMQSAYINLLTGLGFSILLVYLLIVVNFQSWLDPFIIITALPAALAGIVLFLFLTRTTLSVPALMGAIMCMGVATANSILLVSFARERLAEHGDAVRAAVEAGFTRFRPVLMTALAMIIGMVPMALGLGEGGEQNAPLGRAVIGGLLLATVATLVFVPAVFSLLHARRAPRPAVSSGAQPSRLKEPC